MQSSQLLVGSCQLHFVKRYVRNSIADNPSYNLSNKKSINQSINQTEYEEDLAID